MPRTLIAALMVVALAAPAAAQSNPPTQVSGQTSPWRLSKVIGVPVVNGGGEKIGTIADLIMDQQARVTTAIISVGDLGLEQRLVEVPIDVLRFPNAPTTTGSATGTFEKKWFPEKAVLAVTKETLAGMPAFQY